MNKRRIYLVLLILVLFGVFSSAVYAQGMLDTALTPLENLKLGEVYANHPYVIDTILYFIILVGMSQFVFSEQFKGSGGKAIVIGMGVSLSIAASYFEYTHSFKLLEAFGPIAYFSIIILGLVGMYKFATALGGSGRIAGMLAYALLFYYTAAQMPWIETWLKSKGLEWIWAMLNLLALVFAVWGIIELISAVARGTAVAAGAGRAADFVRDRLRQPPAPRTPPAPPAPPGTPVPTPQFTRATGADGGVILEWNNPGGVQGYEIHRQGAGRRARRAFIQNITNPVQTAYFDRVPPGTYTYFIRGVLGGNGSNDSNPINGTPLAARANVYFMPVAGGGGGIAAYWVSLTRPAGGAPSFSNANIGNAFTLYMMAPGGTGIYPIHLNIGAPPAWNFAGVIAQGQFHAISILNLAPPDRVIQPGSVCIADTHSLV